MPTKENYAGQQQPYDENTGEYTKFSNFHKPNNKLKGKTFYHGSPNKYIDKLDENYAGKNVNADYNGIFFTDNKDFANEFAYQRKPKSLMFDEKGDYGKVYEAELEMNNPLDLNNLTEKELQDIKENYMSELWGKEKSWKNFLEFIQAGNIQGAKFYLDINKLAKDGKYDGYIADLGGKYKGSNEYVVFKGKQTKLLNPSKKREQKVEKEKDDVLPF